MSTLAARLEAAIAAMTPPPPRGIQADLARFCGISQPSVSNWFSGRTKQLKGEPLLKAARYLGVRPEWLADGSGPMKLSGVLPAPPKLGLTDALGIVCDAVADGTWYVETEVSWQVGYDRQGGPVARRVTVRGPGVVQVVLAP